MIEKINLQGSIFLNFFRGIAAQMVLIGHLISLYGIQKLYSIPYIQNFGVLVFFVLSGFLITKTTLIKGSSYGFEKFIIDRFSRIYFSFIPAIILVLIIDLVMKNLLNDYDFNNHFNVFDFFSNMLMLQSIPIFNLEPFGSARIFWTISIEWWFYVFFGILYYKKKIFRPLVFLLFSISLLFVVMNVSRRSDLTLYWATGLLFAILDNSVTLKIKPTFYLILFLSIFSLLLFRMYTLPTLLDVGIALLFGFILYLVQNVPEQFKPYLSNKHFESFSAFLASFSYSLYLTHYTIITLLMIFTKGLKDWQQLFLLFFICNVFAYLFYIIFEKNNYKFRDFLKTKIRNVSI